MKRATIDKDRFVGDPAFVDVPLDRLTRKPTRRELAARIRARREGGRSSGSAAGSARNEDTTHISRRRRATAIASRMTHSLGTPSGVITDGLGFMYNGCMGVFDPRPGRAGSLAPGKSRFSAMAPTIVFRGDAPSS